MLKKKILTTIYRGCLYCKKIEKLPTIPVREFKVIEGKRNKKLVCLVCGYKIFIKKKSDPK